MITVAENTELNSLLRKAPGNLFIWNRFLTQLTLQLNCDSSALLVTDLIQPENTHFLFNSNIPQEYQEQYVNELNILDDFNHSLSKNPQQVFCNQYLTDNYGNLTDNYGNKTKSNFIPVEGQNYRFGVSIPCSQSHALNLLVNRKKMFNHVEIHQVTRYLKSIIPSLEIAIHEEQRLKINSQLFNYTGVHFDGYIIIDRELNILFSNPDYPSFIGQLHCMRVSGNRLSVINPSVQQQLLSLIETKDKAALINNQCHSCPMENSCQATLIPMSCLENLFQWECLKDGFILMISLGDKEHAIIDRLEGVFKLTRCEAICALNFMNSPSIQDIAANTYRSQETIRNHIKRSMKKMAVHNQAELMKKLITLAAL